MHGGGGGLITESCSTLATAWTVAHQAPLSMGFSGKNTGGGCHFLLQGIFPTRDSNPSFLNCRQILYRLSYEGSLVDAYLTILYIFKDSCTSIHAAAASLQSCPTLCDPIDGSQPGFPSLGFSRQEHWSGLPFPSPMHESEK